jgi:hypothetical protein
MRDAELLLRYYAFRNYLKDYTGNLKAFLDATCGKLNSEWNEEEQTLNSQLNDFEVAHRFLKEIFSNNLYRKWNGESYEKRFNRAVFDVLILAFVRPDVREAAKNRQNEVEAAFRELCENNQNFLSSIETTTKSTWATQNRISLWNEKLNYLLGTDLPVPAPVQDGNS